MLQKTNRAPNDTYHNEGSEMCGTPRELNSKKNFVRICADSSPFKLCVAHFYENQFGHSQIYCGEYLLEWINRLISGPETP